MISEETTPQDMPPSLELFSIQLRELLLPAFPEAKSKSALSIEVAYRTGLSTDQLRKIFDGKALPMPRTFRVLLALGPQTKRADEVSDLYRKLRLQNRRTRSVIRPSPRAE